jgi:hypothetical protein
MSERNKDGIKEWIDSQVELVSIEYGSSKGIIQYGFRKPIAPQTGQLILCDPNSQEPIGGMRPQYYFVSTEHEGLKIPLSALQLINERTIRANASSAGCKFAVTIRKLND